MLQQFKEQTGEHETKFVFPNNRAHVIISWLKKRTVADPLFAVGTVSSVYYDTRDWVYLNEKINSDYLKTKLRLRWYSDGDTGKLFAPVFLEVKLKTGSAREKIRFKIDRDSSELTAIMLNDPALLLLPKLAEKKGVYLQKTLYPTFQLNYQRYRFIDPMSGSRLCVDYNIHVSRVNPVMINRRNPVNLKDAVFELKEKTGELPDWLHQLTLLGCRRDAFSKYSNCYAQLKRVIY